MKEEEKENDKSEVIFEEPKKEIDVRKNLGKSKKVK